MNLRCLSVKCIEYESVVRLFISYMSYRYSSKNDLYIKSKSPENIMVGGVEGSYDYVVYGERKDIDKLEIEPLKV